MQDIQSFLEERKINIRKVRKVCPKGTALPIPIIKSDDALPAESPSFRAVLIFCFASSNLTSSPAVFTK